MWTSGRGNRAGDIGVPPVLAAAGHAACMSRDSGRCHRLDELVALVIGLAQQRSFTQAIGSLSEPTANAGHGALNGHLPAGTA